VSADDRQTRPGRAPFADIGLARRIERVEAGLIEAASLAARGRTGGAGFAVPFAGGIASFAEACSPFNKVAGVGFEGSPAEEEWSEIEERFAEVGCEVQVELSTLADPGIAEASTRRGYSLVGFENVLGIGVGETRSQVPDGVEVRVCGADELDDWIAVVVAGFAAADEDGVSSHEEFSRAAVETAERDFANAGVETFGALIDGELVGAGGLYVADGIAYLAGAATAPEFRRRGVHGALLAERLAVARERGCDVATITTQPGSTAQRNVWRRGFELLYARAILVKRG
jgi:ribosomal protein S18 acetylase RimI-like enzyme